MRDKWLNMTYEGNELQPYQEPEQELDEKRIGEYRNSITFFKYLMSTCLAVNLLYFQWFSSPNTYIYFTENWLSIESVL